MKEYRILPYFFRDQWHTYAIAFCFIATGAFLQSYFPRLLGEFTDRLKAGELNGGDISHYALLLFVLALSFGLIGGFGQYLIMWVGRYFEYITRKKVFEHFLFLNDFFYSKNGVGKLLNYQLNDITSVRESISMGINQTLASVLLLLSVIFMMITSGIPLYLVFVSITPLILIPFIVALFGPIVQERSLHVQEANAKMTEMAEELFGGIRVTKKFAVESVMNGRFYLKVGDIIQAQIKLVKVSSLFQALLPFLGSLAITITLVYGGYLTMKGEITLGNFVATTLYIRMLTMPLQQIGNVINTVQRSRASLIRLNDLLDVKEKVNILAKDEVDLLQANIEFRNLTFSYPEAKSEALTALNVTIKPGTTLGIVGKTGSGKTTLIKLLLKVYDPPRGSLFIDNQDILDLSIEALRKQIGYVPQDGFLFSTTIKENISFYEREAKTERIEEATKKAQFYDDVQEFPKKFDTVLGERGITLSGGQRQRTGIARGLLKEAPLLILDDSVSAVDTLTEKEIVEMIGTTRKDKTTIIAAHRISALKHAEQIIVLDQGRLVEQGTHDQLLSINGIYADLFRIQEEGNSHE